MTTYRPGPKSKALFERAKKIIPGGVNSPVRAFNQVGGDPLFFKHGHGPYVIDEDGNSFIDYVGSWGPLIFGHAPEFISEILSRVSKTGTSFGAPTEVEVLFAEKMRELVPALEMMRCVSSGTEATMSAIRLARGYTGRKKLIKFTGCYHGHADSLLVKAGSGVATLGIPGSPGVPEELASLTVSIEFNDLNLLHETILALNPETIAAVIIEPVAGNMGLILPVPGYLEGIRGLCSKYGIVLIVDEVMTGFRVALGGAQERFKIKPDLTTFGKIIGGGLPVGLFGGKREIMEQLAPMGPVYQAGTLSGNPLALSVGLEILSRLQSENPYPELEKKSQSLVAGLSASAQEVGVPFAATNCGSMFGFFFSERIPLNYSQVFATNIDRYKQFFHSMLGKGVYFAPSAYEAGFISSAHMADDIEDTVRFAAEAFRN